MFFTNNTESLLLNGKYYSKSNIKEFFEFLNSEPEGWMRVNNNGKTSCENCPNYKSGNFCNCILGTPQVD